MPLAVTISVHIAAWWTARGEGMEPDLSPEHLVSKLDDLVEPAAESENTILVDQSRLIRWVGPMFALFSVMMVPWIVYIAMSLPSRQLSPNYDIAWAGFDVFLAGGLASSAYFALRRSRYLSAAAAATAALLVVDAWFDCMTTPGDARWQSIAFCFLAELPLAAVCLWLSYHAEQIKEQRILILQRQLRRFRRR
jgi:hypothetical protein